MRSLEEIKNLVEKRTKDNNTFDKIDFLWKKTTIKNGLGKDMNVVQVAKGTQLTFYLSDDLEYLYIDPALTTLKIRSASNVAQVIADNLI